MLVSMPKDAPDRKGLGMSAGGARRVPRQEEVRVLTPRQIYDHLDRYVIGQEGAKRAVATAAHQHLKRIEQRRSGAKTLLRKTNLLLMGPTGSGKTHIARNLAELLEVPFTVVDATEYTEAGYYGKDVEVMVAELLFKSGHSIDATERGIIFIDEIDKIARRSGSSRTGAGSRDIGGEGVQQALLKLLEGREIFVPLNVTQHWNKHDFVQIDTAGRHDMQVRQGTAQGFDVTWSERIRREDFYEISSGFVRELRLGWRAGAEHNGARS